MPRKKGALHTLVTEQKWTLLSLLIVLGMFAMAQFTMEAGNLAKQRQMAKYSGQGKLKLGGEFSLKDKDGRVYSSDNLKGHYTLMFFGYMYCPDICPATLALLTDVYEGLPMAAQEQVQVLFVSVDPKRDVAQDLRDYAQAYNPNFDAVTGSASQLNDMTEKFGTTYEILQPRGLDQNDYLVNHSGWIYLLGPEGEYLRHYPHTMDAELLKNSLLPYLMP